MKENTKRPSLESAIGFLACITRSVKIVKLKGGVLPVRAHPDDVGHDCFTRAIVSLEPDPKDRHMRTTIFDLNREKIKPKGQIDFIDPHIEVDRNGQVYWSLGPNETVSISLGFNINIPRGMEGSILPRGSTIKRRVTVTNINPIDPGFDGEPWAELWNFGHKPFRIYGNSRLVQLVIRPVWIGQLLKVRNFHGGSRGSGSNGSTGK